MEPLTDFGISVATEATTSLVVKIKTHFRFLYKYTDNLKNLQVAAENLNAKITDATRFAEATDRRVEDVSSTATHWRCQANELSQRAQKIISKNDISCLNLWPRYSSSKHAWRLTQEINQKVQTAPDFGNAFDRAIPLGAKFNLRDVVDFDSRLAVLNGVLEALRDEEVIMCSICGMGGMGKTTLAKKLVKRVERDRLFDKVAMVTVSQNANLQVIQNEIVEQLGLKIDEGTMSARASKLNAWVTSNRTLLILDDVWWQLNDEDFENIGIPLGCESCKILITSRKEDECQKMGSQRNFVVGVLTDGEAWDLFRAKAGKCVEDLNIRETARKIADECDGLPIAIVTIAMAMNDKPAAVWNDSLRKLQNSNLLGISDVDKMYSRLQLSYDLLNDREAQLCFRLCCLFPEDHNVPIESLVLYGKGLQFFENVKNMKEERDLVESHIHKLKKSFLLLDGENDGSVKMHDIMRDFAISISSKDKHPYIVGFEKYMENWPETRQYENCSAISFVCDTIVKHPADLKCPNLELLKLCFDSSSTTLPVGFFDGMKELKVVDLRVSTINELQQLTVLKKLRCLRIGFLKSSEFSENEQQIGDLLSHVDGKNLEILEFIGPSPDPRLAGRRNRPFIGKPCDDFPEGIGLLCNLRCLKFDIWRFKYMPPGVLSKLVKLEEMELPWEFNNWGCKEGEGERVNASLSEIESLPLTTLKISVRKGSMLPEKLVKNLTKFEIFMGSKYGEDKHMVYRKNSALEVYNVFDSEVRVHWMHVLLGKCEILSLQKVRYLKNIVFPRDNGFPQWKQIEIWECETMEYLVDTASLFSQLEILKVRKMFSLKEIVLNFSKVEASCFINLTRMEIEGCSELNHLFPLPVAREFRQLKFMTIWFCDKMEEIFYRDIDDQNQMMEESIAKVDEKEIDYGIIFPQLEFLKLGDMPNLRIFYDGNHAIEMLLLHHLNIADCNEMEALSYGSFNAPRLDRMYINTEARRVAGEDPNVVWKKEKLEREKEKAEKKLRRKEEDQIHQIAA